MRLIRGRHNLRAEHRGCVATIGNFDGVHRGHVEVLGQLRASGARRRLPTTVIAFEPQPAEFFRPEVAPARLTSLREKLALLAAQGIDRLLLLRFDGALAAIAPDAFVRDLLVERLGVAELVIGDNFRFGHARRGDFALLQTMAGSCGFALTRAQALHVDRVRVSSTRIRQLLAEGDFGAAERLLGHPYRIAGRVRRGNAMGRTIGYPTINIALRRRRSPLHGIFAARVHGIAAQALAGAAYIGRRPVVGDARDILEVHLFDFDGDCYGARAEVEFVRKIRDEIPFTSFADLQQQIGLDTVAVRRVLAAG